MKVKDSLLEGKKCFRVDSKGQRISGQMFVEVHEHGGYYHSALRKNQYVDLRPFGGGKVVRTISASRIVVEDEDGYAALLADWKKETGEAGYNVLLLWEEVPEKSYFYLLRGITSEELARVMRCHRQYVGQVKTSELQAQDLDWISGMLAEGSPWGACKVGELEMPLIRGDFLVVASGMLM